MAQDYKGRADLPRGIRNNNPGNIKTGIAWQGAVGDDGTFIIFDNTAWGLRALATDLTTKINRGLDTIRKIVYEYAPPSENNTSRYVSAVSGDTGIGPDEQLGLDNDTLHSLVRAIVNHENDYGPSALYVSDQDIDEGIAMRGNNPGQLFQGAAIAVENNTGGINYFLVGGLAVAAYLIFRQ